MVCQSEDTNKDQSDHYFINALNTSNEWNITIKCHEYTLVSRIDTGQLIPNIGSCILKCNFENGTKANICFVVVNAQCQTILGWKICEKLGIVKRIFALSEETCHENQRSVNDIVNKYSSTFEGLGCLPTQAHIDVDSSVTPKVCPVRKIPFALHDRLKDELTNMENLKVIEKVIKPTKWVNSIVLVEKPNGKLRMCLDPRNLNVAVKRPHYPYPTFDDLRSKIAGATIFSKLDANSGYWMIPLDSESSDLCTFNTPFGRYKFLRLPYGINSSGEIFHRIMTEIFEGLPGVIVYIDVNLVYGSNAMEHKHRLESVFKRAKEVNLKFNKSKCQFGVTEVKYVGHIFNKKGIAPDMSKIESPIFVDVNARQEVESQDDTLVGETSSSNDSKNSVISVHSSETQSPSTSYSNVESEISSQEITENRPTENVPLTDTPKYSSRGRLIKKKQLFDL